MPVRRATRAKGDEKEEREAEVSGAEAKLAALIDELDCEVDSRCQTLESDAQRMVSLIRSQYRMQLEKLTKKVRGMKIRDLFAGLPEDMDLELPELKALADNHRGTSTEEAEHQEENELVPRTPLRVISNANGSQTVLRTTRATAKKANPTGTARKRLASEVENSDPVPRTTRRAARTQGIIASSASTVPATPMVFNKELPFTPAVGTKGGNAIMGNMTCLRLPKRGESIMNARGSPIRTFTHDATASLIMDDQNKIASYGMAVGDETVDFADPEQMRCLTKETKLKAAQNVLAMQQQLETMLAALRN